MANLARHVPLTPLDELRSLLGQFAEGDAGFQVRLHHLLQQLRQQALPELGARLVSPTAPLALKMRTFHAGLKSAGSLC